MRIGLDHYALPSDALAVALAQGGLHRNFQGYTCDSAKTLLGFGVSAIGRLPQGFFQNLSVERDWRAAVREGRLPTARGVALTDEDRFRGEIIEALMCGFEADLGAIRARHGRTPASLSDLATVLAALQSDGMIEIVGETVRVTVLGRPFVREVCAAFDAYLERGVRRHAPTV